MKNYFAGSKVKIVKQEDCLSYKLSLVVGVVGGTLMGLLMSLVNLATPGSLRFFEFVHSPLEPILGFLDRRFHFETGGDSDSYYWLLAFLCYWIFIGIIASLTIWFICRRKRAQILKASIIFLIFGWLFMAGVLTWALATIHSYGGHWGFVQNVPAAIIVFALLVIGFCTARHFWKQRAA